MRNDSKLANQTVRVLSADEILAVSGGVKVKVPHQGGKRQGQGGGILGEIFNEIFHIGRRAPRDLPLQIL